MTTLRTIVGNENVIVDGPQLSAFLKPVFKVDSNDYLYRVYAPTIVVKPKSTEQVSQIVVASRSQDIPVYVQSGGTDTAGGSAPVKMGVMIDLGKMSRLLELNPESLFATVEGGMNLLALDKQLIEKGLTHGHRPQTYSAASVARTISHYGVGQESSGFGLLADNVLGMTVVLEDGKILRIRAVGKSSMGEKNLLWLFLGSHGQHGIITEVTLRLFPYNKENRKVMLVGFPSFEVALKASFAISREGFKPSMQTVRDRSIVEQRSAMPSFSELGATMALIFDGPRKNVVDLQVKEVSNFVQGYGGKVLSEQIVKEYLDSRDINQSPSAIREHLQERQRTEPTEWSVWTSFLRMQDLLSFVQAVGMVCKKHRIKVRNRSFSASPMTTIVGLAPEESLTQAEAREAISKCRYDVIRFAQGLGGTAASFHSSLLMYESVLEEEFGNTGVDTLKSIKLALDPDVTFGRGQLDTDRS